MLDTTVHDESPYELVTPPAPCRVHSRDGSWHGLVLGRFEGQDLVLHGRQGFTEISWLPDGARRMATAVRTA